MGRSAEFGLVHQVKSLLGTVSVPKDMTALGITGVDPRYGPRLLIDPMDQDSDAASVFRAVSYDDDGVQQVGAENGLRQLVLAYQKDTDRYLNVGTSGIVENLPTGVVQLAYGLHGTVVLGIPGGPTAFNGFEGGSGFALDNPGEASAYVAHAVLQALLEYSDTNSGNIQVDFLTHPDCGLWAVNEGLRESTIRAWANKLADDGSNFAESKYARAEELSAGFSALRLEDFLERLGVTDICSHGSLFSQRTPHAYRILKEQGAIE